MEKGQNISINASLSKEANARYRDTAMPGLDPLFARGLWRIIEILLKHSELYIYF